MFKIKPKNDVYNKLLVFMTKCPTKGFLQLYKCIPWGTCLFRAGHQTPLTTPSHLQLLGFLKGKGHNSFNEFHNQSSSFLQRCSFLRGEWLDYVLWRLLQQSCPQQVFHAFISCCLFLPCLWCSFFGREKSG